MDLRPFCPDYGSNQVVAPAAASANSAINTSSFQVRVVNSGAAIGYFRTYSSVAAVTTPALASATTADCPVLPNTSIIVSKDQQHDRIAYISATGTTFQVQTGGGGFV